MDAGPICHVYKSMEFLKRLNRKFLFFKLEFQILCLLGSMKVMEKYKVSAQYLKNMPARPKKHRDMRFEYHYSCLWNSEVNQLTLQFWSE